MACPDCAVGQSLGLMLVLFGVTVLELSHVLAVDVDPQQEKYLPDYRLYHNLTRLELHVEELATKFKDFIHIDRTFISRNGRSQLVAHITNFSVPSAVTENHHAWRPQDEKDGVSQTRNLSVPKVHLLLSFGEHAREFFPVESALYLLTNLTAGISANPGSYEEAFSRTILSRFDIYVIMMANPDGRKHVESSRNFCWRGTSTGVDINRNFDWQFAKKGSSADPRDEEFRGPYPFSEPECKVYTELTESVKFDAFVSFHSGIRHIYMPYADTVSKAVRRVPPNYTYLSQLASRLAKATKYTFRYGQAFDLNFYTADGTAFDYMAGVRQIPFSLAIEMWENEQHRGRSCFDEFNPHSAHLQKEVEAVHPLYVELFNSLYGWKLQQQKTHTLVETPSLTPSYILLAVVVLACAIFGYRNRHYVCSKKKRIVYLRSLSSTFAVNGIFR
ncbi:hypothetical protein BaRGS_00031278 [Batillaria attramentaria]|uniref:Peptidase M14 domain-containing protein n=1 Tax=Batillaria attramentaria TaxID=370345 RepID=A0ABD0JR27_9CAEN